MIIVTGSIQCDPAHAEDYAARAVVMTEETRKEEGCLQYALVAESMDEGRFVTIERWKTEAALVAHTRSPHVAQFIGATMSYLRGADIAVYDATNQRVLT